MKFALAIFTYALMAFLLAWGVLLLIHGKPWLLIAAVVAYLVAFARLGCQSH
ncbi:MAG TPA: hypothetical protein VFV81_08470 [Verrucomicrobiae bacterium]|nr:hypothetical protein [Verrucomicrobiae bacterium]